MKQEKVVKVKKKQAMEKARKHRLRKQRRNLTVGMILLVGGIGLLMILNAYIKWNGHEIKMVNQKVEKRYLKQWSEVEVDSREQLEMGNLILVNEQHPIRGYSDEGMVAIGDLLKGICNVKSKEIKLNKEAAYALCRMLTDFKKEKGDSDLNIISGYRDFNTQEALHYQSLLEGGDEVFVAKPDRSEHHTGLAVDFGLCYKDGTSAEYDGTGIYSWINENCDKYGFIMRYDKQKKALTGISYEPWHFRYVGCMHAQLMKKLDLCLEEYEDLIKSYHYKTKPLKGITNDLNQNAIYYVPVKGNKTLIRVPASESYTLSGNNMDGFIITVKMVTKE